MFSNLTVNFMKNQTTITKRFILTLSFITLTILLVGCKSCTTNCDTPSTVNSFALRTNKMGELISPAVAFSDLKCEEILRNGIFRYDYVRYNEKYRYDFYDYVYQNNFKSEDDVINSGMSLDLPTDIGIPIGISGHFDYEKHKQWREIYQHERQEMETRDIAYENIKRYADTSITNNWLRCKFYESRTKEKGLQLLIEDAGPEHIIFSATYDPFGSNDPNTKIKKLTIKGGSLEDSICSTIRKGQRIGPGGSSVFIKRSHSQQLSIILETEQSTKTIKYPAPPELAVMFFNSSANEIYKGDSVELKWEIKSAIKISLNGEDINSKGNRKIRIDSTCSFELKALGIFGDSIKVIQTVKAINKPVLLTGGKIIFSVPGWADGKDDDTHFVVEVTNSNGTLFSTYVNNRNDWPIENSSFTDNIPINIDRKSLELRRELVRDCVAKVTKYPNGHDKVTFYLYFEFTFSDNTKMTLSSVPDPADVIPMLEQGQQTISKRLRGN